MIEPATPLLAALLRTGLAMIVLNEVRGFLFAAPVLYGLYLAGGAPMALWIAVCSLAGIALSVAVPTLLAGKLRRRLA